MPYNLYERHYWDQWRAAELSRRSFYGRLASGLIVMGLMSLGTAWLFTLVLETPLESRISSGSYTNSGGGPVEVVLAGPFEVDKYRAVYGLDLKISGLPQNSWTYLEGELLDEEQNYLFSFGRELWHETGVSEGEYWSESRTAHDLKFTIARPGRYYLNLKLDAGEIGGAVPDSVSLKLTRRLGSAMPHALFGLLCLVPGLIIDLARRGTLGRLLAAARAGDDDDE